MLNSLATVMINSYEADLRAGIELSRVARHVSNTIKRLQVKDDWVSKEAAVQIRLWLESKIPC